MSKITFQIEDKEYELPEFLSIENYVKIYKMKDFLEEEYFKAKIIQTITGANLDSLLETNHSQINYLSNYLLKLFPNDKYPFIDSFVLNGVEYGFIPSWKYMSFAEFVDLDSLLTKTPDVIMDNLHIICSIMYRPIISKKKKHDFQIEKYDSKTMEERAELFKKDLDVKYVLGGQFFFSQFVQKYSNYSRLSLIQRMKNYWIKLKITWKMRKIIWKLLLNKRSDGSLSSTELSMMILQNTLKSSKQQSWKPLTSYFTFWKKTKK